MTLLPRMLATAGLCLSTGCITFDQEIPNEFPERETAAEESAPLGGEALAQRRRELQRAHRDLTHFYATLESLHRRKDKNGLRTFEGFLDRYMGTHLEPLLRGEWQSRHPELSALDINLRLAQAGVLIQLRSPRRVQQVIDEIMRRYEGREDMLVEYPIGGQRSLGEGLELIKNRKWRG